MTKSVLCFFAFLSAFLFGVVLSHHLKSRRPADPVPVSQKPFSSPKQDPVPDEPAPKVIVQVDQEKEAADRVGFALRYITLRNFRPAKEILLYVVAEYPETKTVKTAVKLLERTDMVITNVPPYVRKPKPAKVFVGEPAMPPDDRTAEIGFLRLPDEGGKMLNAAGYQRDDGTFVTPYTLHATRP